MTGFTKVKAGKLFTIVARLEHAGFAYHFQRYPGMRNKWKLVFTHPAGAKANYTVIAKSDDEMRRVDAAIKMGGGTF